MANIDYETEYNNRARVPEHPQIFARWTGSCPRCLTAKLLERSGIGCAARCVTCAA